MLGILRSLIVIAAAAAVVGGGTYSYFSDIDTASGSISAGTLTVDLLNQNQESDLTFALSNMFPGDTQLVNFDVKNTSSGPVGVHLRGAASGSWSGVVSPDNDLVKVTKVERWDSGSSSWDEIMSNPSGITGIFYDSDNGLDDPAGVLFVTGQNERAQFRLTVKLDESTGDDYQGKTYNATITVQGKQVGGTWPSF